MKFHDYQTQAISTLTTNHDYGEVSADLMAQVLGLVGESGEVAEKFKKIIRDKEGKLSEDDKRELLKELGDILWYVSAVSVLLGSSLADVAGNNLNKVLGRKARGATKGSGDNR